MMEKDRYERLKARGLTSDSVFEDGRFEELKKLLLSLSGEAVILLNHVDHYEELVSKGKWCRGEEAIKVNGIASHCHQNVEKLVAKKDYLNHMYGFAMSADGVWREHSWAEKKDGSYILETTEKRLLYFGIKI